MWENLSKWFTGPTLDERMTSWKTQLRREANGIEREIRTAQRKEEEIKRDIRQHAKQGPEGLEAARMLARELVQFRKGIEKLYEGKSHLNSIRLQICQQQTNYRVSKAMETSASAMHTLNAALTVPQIRGLTEQLAREMFKVGYISEMIDTTLDTSTPQEEQEADDQVNRVLDEIVAGVQLPSVHAGAAAIATKIPTQSKIVE